MSAHLWLLVLQLGCQFITQFELSRGIWILESHALRDNALAAVWLLAEGRVDLSAMLNAATVHSRQWLSWSVSGYHLRQWRLNAVIILASAILVVVQSEETLSDLLLLHLQLLDVHPWAVLDTSWTGRSNVLGGWVSAPIIKEAKLGDAMNRGHIFSFLLDDCLVALIWRADRSA